MVMTVADKEQQVNLVRDCMDRAISTVLLNFEGVDVETITDLRARFRAAGVEYKVVKNSLIRRALADSDVAENEELNAQLKGMTGLAWSYEDPSSAAKIVRDFRKEDPKKEKLEVKCGILDGDVMDGKAVETKLAALPGKNEIRSMLLAQMLAPMESLVRQINAPGQNMALVLDAYRRQQEGE